MYDMAEYNAKKTFTDVSLTVFLSQKTVLASKLYKKTSLANVYSSLIKLNLLLEAALRRCFSKQEFLETLQYSHENTCVGVCNFIKRRLQRGCFAVNIAKFPRTVFSTEHLLWLLLCLFFLT